MASHDQRTSSVPNVRLVQPLPPVPPLPLSDIPPRLTILTHIPYRDDPEEELLSAQSDRSPSQPPRYEPMYDYLRSRQRIIELHVPANACPNSDSQNIAEEPYRDEPFVVTIVDSTEEDVSQPPPPSYNELYRQNEIEMENLRQEFDIHGSPAEETEELCKWVVAMLLLALTIASVGMAFNWGRAN